MSTEIWGFARVGDGGGGEVAVIPSQAHMLYDSRKNQGKSDRDASSAEGDVTCKLVFDE